jgi:hypothetical protein
VSLHHPGAAAAVAELAELLKVVVVVLTAPHKLNCSSSPVAAQNIVIIP